MFNSPWGKTAQRFHVYNVGTFLGCAGVSQAGEKEVSEGPAEAGRGDHPLAQTGELGRKVDERKGCKKNLIPVCGVTLNRNVVVSSTEMTLLGTRWDVLTYRRCLEEHFGESL